MKELKKVKNKKRKVFIGMSGGVDSSVAAFLLKKQGYEVIGVFMKCFNLDGCAERDAEDARRVAGKLNIPFYVWDFEKEYKKKVVNYMVEGYRKGITPNPDVMCNKEIKFGLFLKKALEMGADFVATGHYVRLDRSPNTPAQGVSGATPKSYPSQERWVSLLIARDINKDQSYFLWTLTQKQLKHCLFPIGDYLKSEVREIARKAGLPTAEKKDSQGICFLGKVTLDEFLKQYIPEKRGAVLSVSGEKLGEHKGAHFYTIGQRHIDIVNRKTQIANSAPIYVVEKNIGTNTLVVAESDRNSALYKKEIELKDINFINSNMTNRSFNQRIFVRVRYRQPLSGAILNCMKKSCRLIFEKPQKYVAPGQSAVFYGKKGHTYRQTGEILGGGVIT
ncbi:MAG: tRNA-specific 2-thiouridylase MnmA [Candidatus Wolfebacteria bacterium GW2011_GWA1_44_24]|uniref:tRNA-specific 2-thiouridylase MnmA n=1 Tax=Candidatus Wolfebacteria bacterium GW2011_GWB1_41_12 TaxID=1619006 RepID=A0A0G0UN20_9BACT|nr:MAG: tRNA-specific 2-thiouridylase MnmA [Candidatus Wolfebacteria bacterium GW2011_GWB1_41_12]KKT56385.1 MAG: tRNA-specific 2-thiouridylase MnmA [Candidatus Wolfebacteria bacterium GW2011_GWA1_44_24]